MKNIKNFTKDVRQEQSESLQGRNPNLMVGSHSMSLEQFEGLRSLVNNLYRQAEKEKEDLVATCNFYAGLSEALENFSPSAEE